MKKSLIATAGVAAFAVAAVPFIGASAVDFTDTLNLTIDNNCAFTRQSTAHGTGETWSPSGTSSDTLTGTKISLNTETTLGTSNYKVVCNNVDGYTVSVNASALNKNAAEGDTTAASIPYGAAAAVGYWSLTSDGTGASYADNYVAHETTTTADESFTVTYKAYPAADQAAGSYTGTAEYTFAQL